MQEVASMITVFGDDQEPLRKMLETLYLAHEKRARPFRLLLKAWRKQLTPRRRND